MTDNTQRFRRHGSRFKARSRAVDILFEAEARDVDPVAVMRDRVVLSRAADPVVPPVSEYTATLVEGVAVDLDGLDDTIARYLAEDWQLDRIPAVDRAILRVSAWELLRNPDVPVRAAVVEGIELAATFSTDAAPPYVNAVLDQIASYAADVRAGTVPAFPELELADVEAPEFAAVDDDEFAGIEFEVDDSAEVAVSGDDDVDTDRFRGFDFTTLHRSVPNGDVHS